MLLLEQNTTRKELVDKNVIRIEFEAGNSKKYKVKVLWKNMVYYVKELKGNLLTLYYLVL